MSPTTQKKLDDYQVLLVVLQEKLGVLVDDEDHAQLRQKLEPVMSEHGYDTYKGLAKALREEPRNGLLSSVLQSITDHKQQWFAYSEVNRLMQEYVLPAAINNNQADFRLWIVGCGQGQMAYSIAVLIEEFRQQHGMSSSVEIVATDLSNTMIEQAAAGHYNMSMLDGLPSAYKQKYMDANHDQWEVNQVLKSVVQFKVCNLLEPFTSMGHFDLIICPDVMAYFSNAVKTEILNEFAELLDPSGMLIVSENEPVTPFCKDFDRVDHEAGVFYRQVSR